jgi:hypothetical protein
VALFHTLPRSLPRTHRIGIPRNLPAPVFPQKLDAVTQTEPELTPLPPTTVQTDLDPAAVNPSARVGTFGRNPKYPLLLTIFLLVCELCVIVVKNHLPSGMAEEMVTIDPTRTIKAATRTRSFLPETGHPSIDMTMEPTWVQTSPQRNCTPVPAATPSYLQNPYSIFKHPSNPNHQPVTPQKAIQGGV